ncbi:hypothetical protein ZHAS_00007504 [Anopheles sinensis]|uniref:Uncharacterized protein n=1 Tax=Anopheles sinensis TaxID=74873 RepID=A0A084VQ01_ANOSI|nr:hypothetical protein ZHAS_00007504 [Anopheles sinensis]
MLAAAVPRPLARLWQRFYSVDAPRSHQNPTEPIRTGSLRLATVWWGLLGWLFLFFADRATRDLRSPVADLQLIMGIAARDGTLRFLAPSDPRSAFRRKCTFSRRYPAGGGFRAFPLCAPRAGISGLVRSEDSSASDPIPSYS